jgi:hypothetical protein
VYLKKINVKNEKKFSFPFSLERKTATILCSPEAADGQQLSSGVLHIRARRRLDSAGFFFAGFSLI